MCTEARQCTEREPTTRVNCWKTPLEPDTRALHPTPASDSLGAHREREGRQVGRPRDRGSSSPMVADKHQPSSPTTVRALFLPVCNHASQRAGPANSVSVD